MQQDELRKNRIHCRDVARVAVASLLGLDGAPGEAGAGGGRVHTFELWTESFGKKTPSLSPGALFTTDAEAVRQKWRDEGRDEEE